MVSGKKTAALFAFVAVAALLLMPLTADDGSGNLAVADDITLSYPGYDILIGAGDTDTLDLHVNNNASENYTVVLEVVSSGGLSANFNNGKSFTDFGLTGGELLYVPLTLEVDKFSGSGTSDLEISMTCTNMATEAVTSVSFGVHIQISSHLASEDQFNKILGFFENPLPYPMNTPAFTAVLSFFLWIGLAIFILSAAYLAAKRLVSDETKEYFREIRKELSWLIFLAVTVYGISESLSIAGVDAQYIALSLSISAILYIILGAIIIWRAYKIIIPMFFSKMSKDVKGVDDTLVPLFNMLGKIVIATVALAAILATLGFNLVAILTGAGILGLALSLGAQNSLNQFFSGMTLLISRPIREGDLVTMKEHSAILRVKSIGLMNTTFHSWENEEVIVMPNSLVASTVITNMSSKNNAYRILIYAGVAHGTDLELAMRLMKEAAYEHPNIITDGSFDTPDTRVVEFRDFDVRLRMAAYVDDVESFGSIGAKLRLVIYDKFRENGVKLSIPEMDIHISES